MKCSELVFDYVHLLFYKYHKINKGNKKSTINPTNKKDKCFYPKL